MPSESLYTYQIDLFTKNTSPYLKAIVCNGKFPISFNLASK